MKLKFTLLSLVISAVMILSSPITAFADLNTDTLAYLEEHAPGGSGGNTSWAKSVSKYFSTVSSEEKSKPIVLSSGQVYYYDENNEETINSQVKKLNEAATATEKVTSITDGLNISADTEQATQLMGGFSPIISVGLGILVVLITIGMTIFSAFDICYIVFPVVRGKIEDNKNSGGPMGKKNSDGSTSLRFVTDEAVFAVEQATTNPGKNAMTIYFGKRIISYIILAIMLFILLTGNISLITNIALKIVDGVLKIIQGIS